ncbi:MAG: IS1634 family transposase [Chloroflexi bacterium]|nr:IS1634 family transposase [Chloroflexota bacterium]
MFLRKHVVSRGDRSYVSYRLCRTVREGDAVRQEIVANLGKLSEAEAARIGAQLLQIAGKAPPPALEEARQGHACLYGGPLLVQALMERAELPALLASLGQTRRRLDLPRTALVALCAQLLAPGSELSVSQWQSTLLWTQPPYDIPYHHFLRALDVLADHHQQIEDGLFARVAHLFNQRVDIVFYDLTSSYFEGRGPADLARRGYSRDGRPDCPQVVLGLAVTKDGFPIAYRLHPGNTVDARTLQQIARDLGQRFAIDRCLIVSDSGLLSKQNAAALDELGLGYLMGMRAASTQAARDAITATAGASPAGQLGDVSYWPTQLKGDRAYIVLHSPGRHAKTLAIAERKLATVRPQLQQLQRDVAAGKVRSSRTIAERATRVLVAAKATPWVRWELDDDGFHWQEDRERLARVREEGGKYVLQTNLTTLRAQEAAVAYRQLEAVEDCFRLLKDTLRLRPIYHRSPHRVMGHVGLCVIALFLLRLLEQRLLSAGIATPAAEALAAVSELQAVPVTVGERTVWPTPHITAKAAAILRAVGITDPKARFVADLEACAHRVP